MIPYRTNPLSSAMVNFSPTLNIWCIYVSQLLVMVSWFRSAYFCLVNSASSPIVPAQVFLLYTFSLYPPDSTSYSSSVWVLLFSHSFFMEVKFLFSEMHKSLECIQLGAFGQFVYLCNHHPNQEIICISLESTLCPLLVNLHPRRSPLFWFLQS